MNIFALDNSPIKCAEMHCDKHVVKMILEYAQLLSTAHRVLDGEMYTDKTSGRKIKRWKLADNREHILYKATHVNHPSAIWARECIWNYSWLNLLWSSLLKEYQYRYGKTHACETLRFSLEKFPNKIEYRESYITPIPQAMPDDCKCENPEDYIYAYRKYYYKYKKDFARWTNRQKPEWFEGYLETNQ